jgi:thiosulfate reductase cytochrome b subunit
MSSLAAEHFSSGPAPEGVRKLIHPRIVRITHWINAVAIIIMIGSGMQIYNAHPILPFSFPNWMTIGGWLGGAILWHFAFMWVLMANFALMLGYGLVSGRYVRKLWPISPSGVLRDGLAALKGHLAHADLSIYNQVQRLLYVGVLAGIILAILSGFAIWKPVQLQAITNLMGGFQGARIVHFIAMVGITGFLAVHVAMALIVPASLNAIVRGR